MTKLDKTLRRRYHQWRKGKDIYRLPVGISEDGYLLAQCMSGYDHYWNSLLGEKPSYRELDIQKTPILAFPPGCKKEGENATASEWQQLQLPPTVNVSAWLLFEQVCGSEDPEVILEPTPVPERLGIGMGHYVSIVLECDRSITIYPTPEAFEELDEFLEMKPADALYRLFEDFCGNNWAVDFCSQYNLITNDGVFYADGQRDDTEFWAYCWSYENTQNVLHEDILLQGEAKLKYLRNDLNDSQRIALGGKSLAQQVAEACNLEVIIH